jgi:hypothetical protein
MRVRHEDWPEDLPSLWFVVPSTSGSDHRCGTYDIRDQYDQPADRFGPWSFDYHEDAEDYTAVCVADDTGDGSHWEAAPGMVFSAHWSVRYVSCSLVRFGLWETELNGDADFFDPDDVDYVGPPDYEAYVPADWHTTSFSIGPWQFEPAETCAVDSIGPCCLRVTATGVDQQCRHGRFEQLPTHTGPMPGPTFDCSDIILGNVYGETGAPCGGQFAGSLSNVASPGTSTVVVWWEIDADKTEITLHVGGDSATFAYSEDWWLTSRTVGDYTVRACPGPPGPDEECDVENECFPGACPCIVNEDGELYRTIYADITGDITASDLPLFPDAGGSNAWQYVSGANAITILCLDPFFVSVVWGPDSYFLSIPSDGFVCTEDGLQIEDITITDAGNNITIRIYTL